MKKRIIAFICAAVMVMTLFAVGAAAAPKRPMQISNDSKVTCLERAVDSANFTISLLVVWAQITPYDDVDWLVSRVDSIVNAVFAYAEHLDIEDYSVECEYVYYIIDGQEVAVDPLKVVNL